MSIIPALGNGDSRVKSLRPAWDEKEEKGLEILRNIRSVRTWGPEFRSLTSTQKPVWRCESIILALGRWKRQAHPGVHGPASLAKLEISRFCESLGLKK